MCSTASLCYRLAVSFAWLKLCLAEVLQCLNACICRVRDFEVIDSYPFGVEFTWEKDGAPHTETLFKRAGPIPSSKMLTFFRCTLCPVHC